MRAAWVALYACVLLACAPAPVPTTRVDASAHDAFWLWAGVAPQPVLQQAHTLYLLEGEIVGAQPARLHRRLGATPRIAHADVWIVYRADTLAWAPGVLPAIVSDAARWRKQGNRVVGVQLDFDARTRGLHDYASFLRDVRGRLPPELKLGITGLLDWSANGDPQALAQLEGVVDEVVLQTYQGRHTIPGYADYLKRLRGFPVPFRIGLVQGGEWKAPATLASHPRFRGYVVFLLNPDDAQQPRD